MNKYASGQFIRKGIASVQEVLVKDGNNLIDIKEKRLKAPESSDSDTVKSIVEDGIYRFAITTEDIDRDGDIVIQGGLDTTDYVKNPVVLWGHNWGSKPIGKVVAIIKDATTKVTYADIKFASTEDGQEVETLVKDGIVKATSIGFRVNDLKYSEDKDAFLLTQTELLELSLVAIPANQNALAVDEPQADEVIETSKSLSQDDITAIAQAVSSAVAEVMTSLPTAPTVNEESITDTTPVEEQEEEVVAESNDSHEQEDTADESSDESKPELSLEEIVEVVLQRVQEQAQSGNSQQNQNVEVPESNPTEVGTESTNDEEVGEDGSSQEEVTEEDDDNQIVVFITQED